MSKKEPVPKEQKWAQKEPVPMCQERKNKK